MRRLTITTAIAALLLGGVGLKAAFC